MSRAIAVIATLFFLVLATYAFVSLRPIALPEPLDPLAEWFDERRSEPGPEEGAAARNAREAVVAAADRTMPSPTVINRTDVAQVTVDRSGREKIDRESQRRVPMNPSGSDPTSTLVNASATSEPTNPDSSTQALNNTTSVQPQRKLPKVARSIGKSATDDHGDGNRLASSVPIKGANESVRHETMVLSKVEVDRSMAIDVNPANPGPGVSAATLPPVKPSRSASPPLALTPGAGAGGEARPTGAASPAAIATSKLAAGAARAARRASAMSLSNSEPAAPTRSTEATQTTMAPSAVNGSAPLVSNTDSNPARANAEPSAVNGSAPLVLNTDSNLARANAEPSAVNGSAPLVLNTDSNLARANAEPSAINGSAPLEPNTDSNPARANAEPSAVNGSAPLEPNSDSNPARANAEPSAVNGSAPLVLNTDSNWLGGEPIAMIPPEAAAPKPRTVEAVRQQRSIINFLDGKIVEFQVGRDALTVAGTRVLDRLVPIIKANQGTIITIQGHTDDVGDDVSNLELSGARAIAARRYLISRGISATRLRVQGLGERFPIADNNTEAGRIRNRRIDFAVSDAG